MKTYLLVGEAPARDETKTNLELTLALKATGKARSREDGPLFLLDENPDLLAFTIRTTHVNLLRRYPGPARRGAHFPLDEAKLKADRFREAMRRVTVRPAPRRRPVRYWSRHQFPDPYAILIAGRRVARAFGVYDVEYFVSTTFKDLVRPTGHPWRAIVVPHPSGVNRWWNDERNQLRAHAFLASLGRGRMWTPSEKGATP